MSSFEILESMAFVGVLVVDGRNIIYANGAAGRILGRREKDLVGLSLDDIFSKTALETFWASFSQIESGNRSAIKIDISCRREDGTNIFCILSLAATPKGLIVVSLHDAENGLARDYLTGLYMRRAFFVLAEHEMTMARRNRKPVYLFFIDVDGLKKANDLGYAVGDELLAKVADVLKQLFRRASDLLCRLGGDEFCVLVVSDSGTENAQEMVKRMKSLAEKKSRSFELKHGIKLSFSCGWVFCIEGQPLQLALDAANALMRREKYEKKIK